ncbi:MAG TPA: CoA ester lyase [Candidatus Limnocylindria bacterium]|nr:CoA ester lyase [Candidatus Limnocylindria bacterium]
MIDAPLRSLLYTPGHREAMVAKVLDGGLATTPDVALLDLEDGVPPAEKETARRVVAAALQRSAQCLRFVRLSGRSSSDQAEADLAAVVRPGLDGVVVPKVARAEELAMVDEMLASRESEAGLARGSVKVIASAESAAGLIDAPRIARGPRVVALMFGSEDLANDLGLPTRREGEAAEMLFARSAVVVAAAAARVPSIDGIWADFRDEAGLRDDALRGRRLGFSGRQCIHPDQVAIVNEIFSPSADEVAHARRVVEAFEAGVAKGLGAVALDGEMLDAPIVERARRVLRMARS